MCAALKEMGVRKVIANRQTSSILSQSVESASYTKLVSFSSPNYWPIRNVLTLIQDSNLRRLGAPVGTIPVMLNTSIHNNGYNPSKNSFKHSPTRRSPSLGVKQTWFDQL